MVGNNHALKITDAFAIVKTETVIRWHRDGFCLFWRWNPRLHSGRPKAALAIRQLIRDVSLANRLCGTPRIHGELLKLGVDIGQTSVAKYMAKRRRPPSQGWKTFVAQPRNGIASMDLFVVPTGIPHRDISFATATAPLARSSNVAFARSAFVIAQPRRARPGRTAAATADRLDPRGVS
ncbi:MAG: hypothetical protein ACR652_02885 [Methylocystis sp.]|uniref:hypothetical protein n=1 Tax=Methylocystis sp. TaxID=1911079 RepID=UPI003DA31BB5